MPTLDELEIRANLIIPKLMHLQHSGDGALIHRANMYLARMGNCSELIRRGMKVEYYTQLFSITIEEAEQWLITIAKSL